MLLIARWLAPVADRTGRFKAFYKSLLFGAFVRRLDSSVFDVANFRLSLKHGGARVVFNICAARKDCKYWHQVV